MPAPCQPVSGLIGSKIPCSSGVRRRLLHRGCLQSRKDRRRSECQFRNLRSPLPRTRRKPVAHRLKGYWYGPAFAPRTLTSDCRFSFIRRWMDDPITVWILRNASSVIILHLLSMNEMYAAPHKSAVFGRSVLLMEPSRPSWRSAGAAFRRASRANHLGCKPLPNRPPRNGGIHPQ